MIAILLVLCGAVYHLVAIIACLRFQRRRPSAPLLDRFEPVSILKPVRGRDVGFYPAIRSHALLNYPADFEILFGISDPNESALTDIQRLQREFPHLPIQFIYTSNDAPNGKAGALEILYSHARYDTILLNDSDILVEPDYLTRVVTALNQPNVGLVTCLYRGEATSIPAKAECLGISTDFAPSVLVADLLSASVFAFGSTIALRRVDLDRMGGFKAVQNYLADDYQLGARIAKLGLRVILANQIVQTHMGAGSWHDVWKHQLRWTRTIRVSNPAGYFGFAITQLTFWSLITAILGHWQIALAAFALRLMSAAVSMKTIGDPISATKLIAVPIRDLAGAIIWAAGLVGNTVEWRGLTFRLHRDGTMTKQP